jgi:hypothetical protein
VHRPTAPLRPEVRCHDPARPASSTLRGFLISGDEMACAIDVDHPVDIGSDPATTPICAPNTTSDGLLAAVSPRLASLDGRPHHEAEDENPIALRLRPAGSVLGDFRTPAGARNSSRKRNGSCSSAIEAKLLRKPAEAGTAQVR